MDPVRRIHIVGAAGSGKTTLARHLAERLAAPWYELDTIVYEGGSGPKRPFEARIAEVKRIAKQPAWLTEGSYLWWAADLFRSADCIIWLDLPWTTAISRIIIRHIKASWRGSNPHPGVVKLARFVWRYRKYYMDNTPDSPTGPDDDNAGNRAATARFLTEYAPKLVRCRNRHDIEAVVARIERVPAEKGREGSP